MQPAATRIVWRPDPAQAGASRLGRFIARHGFPDYDALYRRSVEDPAWFWDAVVLDLGLQWFRPYTQVLDTSRGIPWARWFVGGQTNLVWNCLDRHVRAGRDDHPAIIYEGDDGTVRTLTYEELLEEVCRLAAALQGLGIGRGDVAGVFLPMIPEAAIATLALARIGAICIPCFSGFAAAAVATRLADGGARLLITADGFTRRDQVVPMKETADAALAQTADIRHVLVVRHLGRPVPWTEGRDRWWHEVTRTYPRACPPAVMDSEDPFMLIYTSGTTGRPKGCVHVHMGFPLKAAMDMAYCFDVGPQDRVFWYTDLGWMMGPWLILGTLLLGATMVLYDGTPDHPTPARLWHLVERHRATVLGVSPTAIRVLMRYGTEIPHRHDLSSLRILGSTGEPWNPEPWMWYFEHVGGGRLPIMNYSGGTEISGGIVCCDLLHPQVPTAFTGPIPGMAADVYDEQGRSVRGEVGELVLTQPWPGMTRGFWRDPQRYLETYWSRWPGVWVHGDWVRVDDDGFWYILGRSDDTLNVAGKRIGPAEVESALTAHPAVAEAAAIGIPHAVKGEAIACFVVLRPGHAPGDALRDALRQTAAGQLGKALAPEEIHFVRDLPKTRNAKVMRRVIRARYLGQDPGDLTSLENPQAVEEIPQAARPGDLPGAPSAR
ncbi:MAG: acetate--CoA ligase [Armatimonadota bacterium]|nr:acetate--CoA ligase [Armatimonadota bacterium]MDR7485766.1 acetate--CoA ligase [Armatimonadota bacterium]MDR7534108.1 acetate--CoA ligase [Armatimonadota bacterium]MDR7535703.1 acetate--CoA ligase [Armatimonadota bacterium]